MADRVRASTSDLGRHAGVKGVPVTAGNLSAPPARRFCVAGHRSSLSGL